MQPAPAFGIHLPELLVASDSSPRISGESALAAILGFAEVAIERFLQRVSLPGEHLPLAAIGRVRGRGPRVSFGSLVDAVRRDMPRTLVYPFEGSDRVGGAVWVGTAMGGTEGAPSLALLRWESRALDLPMHVHDHSDRVIIVLEGRGFFHVSPSPADGFDGSDVRTVAARERDVFLFRRGTVHTFSTRDSPMALVSCQLPYLAFEDPRQYRVPAVRWTAKELDDDGPSDLVCEPAWSVIAARPRSIGTLGTAAPSS